MFRYLSIIAQLLILNIFSLTANAYWNGNTYSVEIHGGGSSDYLLKAKYSIFIPKNAEKIRGILIHQHGCGAEGWGQPMVTDAQYQVFADKWNFAVLGPDLYPKAGKNCYDWVYPDDGSANSLLAGLDSLAKMSGHTELKTVPWLLWGHSGGGHWVLAMTKKFPLRTIATFAYSPAFDPSFEYPNEALKVPIMIRHAGANDFNVAGIDCWGTALHTFDKLRSKGGLTSIAFNENQNHNYSFVRQMALPFFESVLKQRLSNDSTNKLNDMDLNKSWLVDTNTFSKINIYKYIDFKGDKLSKSWLPDSLSAEKFKEFLMSGYVVDITPPQAPMNLSLDINNKKIKWEANADIQSGIKFFKIYKNDNFLANYPENLSFQTFDTNGDTPIPTDQPLMEFAVNDAFLSNLNTISISTVNNAGLESEKTKLIHSSLLSEYKTVYYISPNGSDKNPGTYNLPFLTINKAKSEIRKINTNIQGNIAVFLMDGLYAQDSSLVFDYDDSGFNGNRIYYKSFDCQKPIISGGITITNWKIHDAGNNIYKANIDKSIDTRQLYVNGRRAIRSKSKDAEGWTESGDGYNSPINISTWSNISNIEIVARNEWKNHRGLIESMNGNHIKMAQPYWDNVHKQYDAPPVWIENAYELIDSEDEWYLDKNAGVIYYKPRLNEDINKSEIILPKLELLIKCTGLQNVDFEGLTFSHATWLTPNSKSGYPVVQADVRFSGDIWVQNPGNIILEYCKNVNFENSKFEHLGVTAIQLYFGCKNNKIFNNTFQDISGSAVSIGSILTFSPSENDLVKDNSVENNLIRDIGLEYESSVGIFAPVSEGTIIKNNSFINLPYSAISIGWGWSNLLIAGRNTQVSFNRIDSIMTKLKDGGGIYTLSSLPGSNINNNYISNVMNGFGALYPDYGTSNTRWHHNVVKNVKCWLSLWSDQCFNDTIDYNYFDNQINVTNGTNCVVNNNIFVENGKWNNEALDIMNKSAYKENINLNVPSILSQPKDTIIEKGNDITFEIKIRNYNQYNILYKWYNNDKLIFETKDSFLKFSNIDTSYNGNYKCEILTGCGNIFSIPFSLKVKETFNDIIEINESSFSISPNPASDFIEINVGAGSKPALMDEIEIFNIFGELQDAPPQTPPLEGRGLKIDVSNLPAGVYFIKIGDKFEKFMKM
jgi:pimeloyl-ACP methyl ester carboxylesterase